MPYRHFITTVISSVVLIGSANGVELTLTDANVPYDDIRVSNVGSTVTVADTSSHAPKVVAYPDLTRQGRKTSERAYQPSKPTIRPSHGTVSYSDDGLVGRAVRQATAVPPSLSRRSPICQCSAVAGCACGERSHASQIISSGPVDIGGLSTEGEIVGDEFFDDGAFGGSDCGCDDLCGSGCGGLCGEPCRERKGIVLDFWLSQGFTWNTDDPDNNSNVPLTFNDRSNEYQMNQLYLALGREVSTSGGWDIGGRVDLLYGTDYFFTQSAGLETRTDGTPRWNSSDGPRRAAGSSAAMYGLAMPQLYMELFAPIGPGIKFKLGHFYTAIGYESVMAPENFFYSHAFTMQYAEPFTHTGMLSEFALTRRLDVLAGFTRGWDNWEDPNSDLGFLGGFSWTAPSEKSSIALTVHSSSEDADGNNNRTVYSLVYTRRLGCRFQYIMQHDFGTEELAEVGQDGTNEVAKWYGINNYLLFDASDRLRLGIRAEWFRDQDNSRVLALPLESVTEGGNYFGLTAGANWQMADRWTLRPEIRWDWSDVEVPSLGREGMYNNFTERNQLTLATDMIFRF